MRSRPGISRCSSVDSSGTSSPKTRSTGRWSGASKSTPFLSRRNAARVRPSPGTRAMGQGAAFSEPRRAQTLAREQLVEDGLGGNVGIGVGEDVSQHLEGALPTAGRHVAEYPLDSENPVETHHCVPFPGRAGERRARGAARPRNSGARNSLSAIPQGSIDALPVEPHARPAPKKTLPVAWWSMPDRASGVQSNRALIPPSARW